MKTYVLKVRIEPDEDVWRAFYPAWEHIGASTWGCSKEEALKNFQEVLQLVLEDMVEMNDPIPEIPEGEGFVSIEPQVAVSI